MCRYNPCGNNKPNSGTTFQQHQRYFITQEKEVACPRAKFREDLVVQLKKWRAEGDRIVVCMDANEDIYRKLMGKALTDQEGLNMSVVVGDFTGKKLGATFFRETKPIDGIWATKDIMITHACVMPVGYGVGDHPLFVIDMLEEFLIGQAPFRVIRGESRRLNTKVSGVAMANYMQRLEGSLQRHKILERMQEIHRKYKKPGRRLRRALAKLDKETKQLMINAEKNCRKIKSGRIPFSPEAAIWIRLMQVYKLLLRYHQGRIRNRANLGWTARRCRILNCLQIPVESLLQKIEVCHEKCNYFRKHGRRYCTKHLHSCANAARDRGDDRKAQEILDIIQWERDRSFWRKMNLSLGKKRGTPPRRVLVENPHQEGELLEYDMQHTMQEAVFDNVHRKRFFLAEAAPICQEPLHGLFGYNSDTETAREILAGTNDYPKYFDTATKKLCQECTRLREIIPEGLIDTAITTDRWKSQWRRRKESMSSSESRLHFGHYIAGAQSDIISCMHAAKATLVINKGEVLER